MKNFKYLLTIALLATGSFLFAQQESTFTMYRNHMNIFNPAYAGLDDETVITATYRNQWTGIEESPVTQAVSFGMPLGVNLGLGLSIVNDKTFIEKQTNVSIDFSYKIIMNETTDLYFGVKASGNFYDLNASGLETYNLQSDPALSSISTFNPNVGVGAVLKNENYYVSLSVPRLFQSSGATNEEGYVVDDPHKAHFYLSGGYDFLLNTTVNYLVLKPSIMMRYTTYAPISVDFNTMLAINEKFEIGAMYRTDKAYAAMANIFINKHISFGYAYEMSTHETMASANGTHEFLLKYKL
jgi:type IX secretion system PorP/SprF family membrane protein